MKLEIGRTYKKKSGKIFRIDRFSDNTPNLVLDDKLMIGVRVDKIERPATGKEIIEYESIPQPKGV